MAKNIIGFIRDIFNRDNFNAEDGPPDPLKNSSGVIGSQLNMSSIMGVSTSNITSGRYNPQGYNAVEDLLSRYADYENMDDFGELSNALDIISDESCQEDFVTNKIIHVKAEDPIIEDALTHCFEKNIEIDDHIWEICRTLCLCEGTRVWTKFGLKEIQHLRVGEEVQSYEQGEAVYSNVKEVIHNGQQRVFKIKTRHREILATEEHKFPVLDSRGRIVVKKVKDIKCKRHPNGAVNYYNDQLIIACKSNIVENEIDLHKLLEMVSNKSNKGTPIRVTIPKYPDKKFVRLVGFLIGDGYYADNKSSHSLTIARGVDNEVNLFYEQILSGYGLNVSLVKEGQYSVCNSIDFVCLLKALGMKKGAVNKRVPEWVFGLSSELREEFLWGLWDADGWMTDPKSSLSSSYHFELCNRELLVDVKNLIDGLGYKSGNIRSRHRRVSAICGVAIKKDVCDSYTLTFKKDSISENIFETEYIIAIEYVGIRSVYDINIDSNDRLFVAEGVVTHNCKYGNNFEEHIVSETDGLVGIKFLPPPQMRRIDDLQGGLVGFAFDKQGTFNISTDEFMRRLNNKAYNKDQYISSDYRQNIYEDWEVTHFRMRARHREATYGYGVLDSARHIMKRLMLLEDAALLYKLCLRGDSNIWTSNGFKKIKEIQEGDCVYSFGHDGELKKANVIYKKCNGRDKIFRVYSNNRDLFGNKTHPVLVKDVQGQGRGREKVIELKYVEVQNLIPKKHLFVMPTVRDTECSLHEIVRPEAEKRIKLKSSLYEGLQINWADIQRVGVSQPYAIEFLKAERSLPYATGLNVILMLGVGHESFDVYEQYQGIEKLYLPQYADEEFARFFGFLLGDGFVSEIACGTGVARRVGFALGDDDSVNEYYKKLFEKFVGKVTFSGDSGHRLGSYLVASKWFTEMMLLNGFIPGCYNKRIPAWVFQSPSRIKMALLEGLFDADANWSTTKGKTKYRKARIELANKELVEDTRELAMQIGLVTTRVKTRKRCGGRTIKGSTKPLPDCVCHNVEVTFKPEQKFRLILGIEEVGEDEIYDIGVDADEHNFVADGVVVHNTRAPQRFAFNIDVGDVPPNEIKKYLNDVKNSLKKQNVLDPSTGKLDIMAGLINSQEDIFIPVRKDRPSMNVDTVGGFDAGFYMDDLQYFKDKLYATVKVPKDYLNYTEDSVSKANLSTLDIRFSRTILRVQKELKKGVKNMARVHLAALGYDPDLIAFDIAMPSPSSIFEQMLLEVKKTQLDIAEQYRAFVSDDWILKNILKFTDDEIAEVKLKKPEDAFAESRFPKIESKERQMNKEVEKMMNDLGKDALEKDKVLGKRIKELQGLAEDLKYSLKRFKK